MPEKKANGKKKSTSIAPFPIVGLGASAGGLDALKAFFSKVPADSGMAFIVVVHLSPKQPSLLPELLAKGSEIPVLIAADGRRIQPGHAYVIPPNKEATVFNGKIQLLDMLRKGVVHPIDSFLRSLALDQGDKAAAVIFSGTGTDGTLGLKEIKSSGGLVVVQSMESAGYDGMPRSAIDTGLADMVLPPEEMPKLLAGFYAHPQTALDREPTTADAIKQEEAWLSKIFAILRARLGYDFSVYKANTILRRISRRMGLNQIDTTDQYVRYLRENPGEVEGLFRELLIGVTSFFRDAQSFDTLKTAVLPPIFDQSQDDSTFRAWVPGCSTGEEVYSMAMVLHECLDAVPRRINLQLFGTDIDNRAIEKAREGLYPASIATDVGKRRLKRFFNREGEFYRIRKEIRDCVVYSTQDVIKDPPFSRLNLLCCRNLLIYLNGEAQQKLLPLFHYTLVPEGILVLGSSETIGGFTSLFKVLDKKWKIFQRREVPHTLRQLVDFPSGSTAGSRRGPTPALPAAKAVDISQATRQAILDQFAPTAVLVEETGEILHVQGRTGNYLETPSGAPTNNILNLVREGLRIELSSALRAAKASKNRVCRSNIGVKTNGDVKWVDLHVCPQHYPREIAGRFLVIFKDVEGKPAAPASGQASVDDSLAVSLDDPSRINALEKELQATRESHQTATEELESSNEELKSANEELQSSNEELQSTNEELESSKEELQSVNEELQTVNAEMESRMQELSSIHDDMRNLLNSTDIATIFVDNQLCVKRFTQGATTIVNLIPTDIGRPLEHVVSNLSSGAMIADLSEVLRTLAPKNAEVRTEAGGWYNMRILPYRTTDNRIDGAVLTFAAIGDQKKTQGLLEDANLKLGQAWELTRAIFDMNADPMVVIDENTRMVIGNAAFSEFTGISQQDLIRKGVGALQNRMPEAVNLHTLLETAIATGRGFSTEMLEMRFPKGNATCSISGRIILQDADGPRRVLLQFAQCR